MIQLKQFVFNPFQENTYVLFDETLECVIVDAGCYTDGEQEELTNFIESHGLTPRLAINTHGHVDHVLGNGFVKEKYGIPLAGNFEDLMLIQTAQTHALMFGLSVDSVPSLDQSLNHDDTISFGNSHLRVIHTPGHSLGGICLYTKAGNFILTGDTLFNGSIGRTDLPGGSYDILIDSIITRILPLGDEVKVFPGHGDSSTIGYERKNNPFLQKQ
ncbi:MAG TPA: MBL fold metallo-hydrolase [Tenuifilaceae bacterium]|nr:MBL fold metallo-hydrolase [Tenuifilaceae bacterium]